MGSRSIAIVRRGAVSAVGLSFNDDQQRCEQSSNVGHPSCGTLVDLVVTLAQAQNYGQTPMNSRPRLISRQHLEEDRNGLAWRAIHPKEYMLLFVVALLSIPPGSICSSEIRRKALGRAVDLSK